MPVIARAPDGFKHLLVADDADGGRRPAALIKRDDCAALEVAMPSAREFQMLFEANYNNECQAARGRRVPAARVVLRSGGMVLFDAVHGLDELAVGMRVIRAALDGVYAPHLKAIFPRGWATFAKQGLSWLRAEARKTSYPEPVRAILSTFSSR